MKIGQSRIWLSDAPTAPTAWTGGVVRNATVFYGASVPVNVFWAHLALGGQGAVVHRKHGLVHLFRTTPGKPIAPSGWRDCTYHFVDRIEHDSET